MVYNDGAAELVNWARTLSSWIVDGDMERRHRSIAGHGMAAVLHIAFVNANYVKNRILEL